MLAKLSETKRFCPMKATGQHFDSPGHSLSDLCITVLERVRSNDYLYRKEREKYFIRILFTEELKDNPKTEEIRRGKH